MNISNTPPASFRPYVYIDLDVGRLAMPAVARGALASCMRAYLPARLALRDEATQRRIARRAVARLLRQENVRHFVRRFGPPHGHILYPARGVAINLWDDPAPRSGPAASPLP